MKLALWFATVMCAAGAISPAFSAGRSIVYDPPLLVPIEGEYECEHKFPPSTDEETAPGAPKLLYRCPPIYPDRCERRASRREVVDLLYDVSTAGIPVNIRITQTTNKCLNEEAAIAVAKWRYEAGEVTATDLTTTMTFELR